MRGALVGQILTDSYVNGARTAATRATCIQVYAYDSIFHQKLAEGNQMNVKLISKKSPRYSTLLNGDTFKKGV